MAYYFPDRNQNFWQLTCIQSASQSIPGLLVGGILSRQYGPKTAILSICVGNLILWMIGLGVISMAFKERKNAVENVRGFLGKGSSIAMAVILILAFLSWYMLEIHSSIEAIAPLFHLNSNLDLTIFGGVFGVIIAFISIGGIRLIRHITVFSFPFLICFVLYQIFTSDLTIIESSHWGLSFTAIITIVAITLPGTVNLPTFFRHSHSRADSFLAITLIAFFFVLFQIFSIFTNMSTPIDLLFGHEALSKTALYPFIVLMFVILLSISLNLINIYFASAGLELICPGLAGGKGNLVVGLIGTAIYVVLVNPDKMVFLENVTDNFIANLGVVLLISFLIKTVVKHRPRTFELIINSICWAIGSIVAVIVHVNYPLDPNKALIFGVGGTIISFLCIIFIEETIWAIKKLVPNLR